MPEFAQDKDGRLQFRPISEAQWVAAVEAYQGAKVLTDGVNDCIKALAEQANKTPAQIRKVIKARADDALDELREDLQGTLELAGGE